MQEGPGKTVDDSYIHVREEQDRHPVAPTASLRELRCCQERRRATKVNRWKRLWLQLAESVRGEK